MSPLAAVRAAVRAPAVRAPAVRAPAARAAASGLRAALAALVLGACDADGPVEVATDPEPDSLAIVFASYREGVLPKLYRATPGGRGVTRLLGDEPAAQFAPSWAPGGRQIAFLGFPRQGGQARIYVVEADGSGLRLLGGGLAGSWPAAWSPRSRQIAYVDGPAGIRVVDVSGSGDRVIPGTAGAQGRVAWSPDGTRLAYSTGSRLHLVRADGSASQLLVANPGCSAFDPAWSPDGTRIAYVACTPPPGSVWELIVMRPDGSGRLLLDSGRIILSPSWSPDGGRIVYEGLARGAQGTETEIYSIGVAGGGRVNLTNHPSSDRWPDWRPGR